MKLSACFSVVLLLTLSSPVQAQVAAGAGAVPGAAAAAAGGNLGLDNEQTNSSTVGGSLYNTQVNQSAYSEPSFYRIRDVQCSEPILGFASSYNQYVGSTIVATVSVPISGPNCEEMAAEYVQQAQLDTYLNTLSYCQELLKVRMVVIAPEGNEEAAYLAATCATLGSLVPVPSLP